MGNSLSAAYLATIEEAQMLKSERLSQYDFEYRPIDTARVVLTADRNPPEEMEPSYFGAKEAEASGDIEISGYVVRQDRILN